MSIDIDGFRILAQLAGMAKRYVDLDEEVVNASRRILAAIIKGRHADARLLVRFREDFGAQTFALVCDGLNLSELRAVLKRVDRFWPDLKRASADQLRRRLRDMAAGHPPVARPRPVQEKAIDPPTARVLSPVFTASWDGIDRDS